MEEGAHTPTGANAQQLSVNTESKHDWQAQSWRMMLQQKQDVVRMATGMLGRADKTMRSPDTTLVRPRVLPALHYVECIHQHTNCTKTLSSTAVRVGCALVVSSAWGRAFQLNYHCFVRDQAPPGLRPRALRHPPTALAAAPRAPSLGLPRRTRRGRQKRREKINDKEENTHAKPESLTHREIVKNRQSIKRNGDQEDRVETKETVQSQRERQGHMIKERI